MADFYFLGNSSYSQMFGAVIKTESKTIVIDGGTVNDCDQLLNTLSELSSLHVDAWFFTHPHHDHIGAFVTARQKEKRLTVDKIYYRFLDLDTEGLSRSATELELWKDAKKWDTEYDTHRVCVGDVFTFDDVSFRVLRVYNPEITANPVNNSSTVYRIDGHSKSVLILGDLGVEGGKDTLEKCPVELLHTDYTQLAHHGQQGVNKAFYEAIKPKACLWAAPDWLWDNNRGGGFDSDRFVTVRTREWMAEIGATEHLVEKDGTHKFEI